MHQLTTITRTSTGQLPESLALLSAPLIGDATSPETKPLGQVEGAIVDEGGHIAFLVVRAAEHMNLTAKRVLVPLAALTIEESERSAVSSLVLRTSWTRDQLLAQPDFAEDHQLPTNRTDGSPPVEGRWAPAVPNIIPPGSGVNRSKAMIVGLKWGLPAALVGLVIGALVGYVAGSVYAAIMTGIFFGLASGIAGAIAGATRDSAVDAGEIHAMSPVESGSALGAMDNAGTAGLPYVRTLETALAEKSLFTMGILKATLILPTTQRQTPRMEKEGRTPSILEASKPIRT